MGHQEILENGWKNEIEQAQMYIAAEAKQSEEFEDVRVQDAEYNFESTEQHVMIRDAYEHSEDVDEFYERLDDNFDTAYEIEIGSVEFDGWIGDYFGDMEAKLKLGNKNGSSETYWEVDTGHASIDSEKHQETVRAVEKLETTLEETSPETINRNTQAIDQYPVQTALSD